MLNECENIYEVFDENGIDERRILNKGDFNIGNFKCCICNNLAANPMNCNSCGEMFCNKCITDWKNNRGLCPLKCTNTEFNKINQTLVKKFDEILLSCQYSPECSYSASYWDIICHDKNCSNKNKFENKIKNQKDNNKQNITILSPVYEKKYDNIKINEYIEESYLSCSCCNKINEELQIKYIDMNVLERFHLYDTVVDDMNRMVRCLCKKTYCMNCISNRKNVECVSSCYLFHTGCNNLSMIYNISKYELPKNWEAKIYYNKVDWVRTGITFDKQIIVNNSDNNSPSFDISYVLEDLFQIYHEKSWKNVFRKGNQLLAGDTLTLTMFDNHLRYSRNGIPLGDPIEMKSKKNPYLLVHRRNNKTEAIIFSIVEILGIA